MDKAAQLSGARYASDSFERLEQQERFLRAVISHMAGNPSRDSAQFADVTQLLQLVLDQKAALCSSFVSTYFKSEEPKGK
jgi:hypothetical protein